MRRYVNNISVWQQQQNVKRRNLLQKSPKLFKKLKRAHKGQAI